MRILEMPSPLVMMGEGTQCNSRSSECLSFVSGGHDAVVVAALSRPCSGEKLCSERARLLSVSPCAICLVQAL